jgi:asparagine synthase (glutamine-hydrolysing)
MQCQLIASLFAHIAAGHHQEYHDIYVSHPYSYRPLVEFCLAVPLSQGARDGISRSLMRRSFRNILPPGLLARRSKGTIDETFFRAIRREWDDVGDVSRWQLCQRGLVKRNELLQDLEQARAGYHKALAGLIRAFSLERWLRSLGLANQQPLVPVEEFAEQPDSRPKTLA